MRAHGAPVSTEHKQLQGDWMLRVHSSRAHITASTARQCLRVSIRDGSHARRPMAAPSLSADSPRSQGLAAH